MATVRIPRAPVLEVQRDRHAACEISRWVHDLGEGGECRLLRRREDTLHGPAQGGRAPPCPVGTSMPATRAQ